MKKLLLLPAALLVLGLAACGQKGPLYLPDAAPPAANTANTANTTPQQP